MTIKNTISCILGTIISLGAVGALLSSYSPFAIADKLTAVELVVSNHIVNQNINDWQKRIWLLQDRYYGRPMTQSVIEEIRNLQLLIDQAKKRD